MNLTEHLHISFTKAENEESKITQEILEMEGMTGNMTRHFYNNLLSTENIRYLEVGTWKGSSTCAAIYENKADVVCVDNWSEFHDGDEIKEEFLENLEKYKGQNKVEFIEADCFSINTKTLKKFNVYLYDGGHKKEDHYNALAHFYDCLEDEFIYICDDWDWADVRNGTWQAINELNLEVISFKERSLQEGDSWKPTIYAKLAWWNGIWAAVLKKNKKV